MHELTFIHELNLIVNRYGDTVRDDDLLRHQLGIYEHEEFRPGMDVLASFAATRRAGLTAEGLRHVARTFVHRSGRVKESRFVAVVVRSSLGHGLTRLYGAHTEHEGTSVDVFRSVTAGADWLDLQRERPAGTTTRALQRVLGDGAVPNPATG